MPVTEFASLLWANKIKTALVVLAIAFGPNLYENWSKKRDVERKEEERKSVGISASVTGMMILGAWKSCNRIGIADIDSCSRYEGQLIQEQAAPALARTAVENRNGYLKTCLKFFDYEYCRQLLNRAVQLSAAESKE